MTTVSGSVDIPAPAGEVFDFVARAENYPHYIPAYESGTVVSGDDGYPGMKLRWHTRLAGLRVVAEETVVERRDGRLIRYRGTMLGVPFESSMETQPRDTGTRFTVTIGYELPPLGRAPLASRLVKYAVADQVSQTLDRLAAVFEARRAGSAGESSASGDDATRALDSVQRIYAKWGRHPTLYAAQDWVTFMGSHRTLRRKAVQAMGVGPGARVLEVACGSGRNFPYLEAILGPSGTLVGFDFSREMLAAARGLAVRRGWHNIELVQGDAAVLAVPGGPFDGVVSVLGMSAIPDHVRALERCREVLRPGGVLSVCDARPLRGALRPFNPLVGAVYRRWAAWNPDRDLADDARRVFGNVAVESFKGGAFFIIRSRKEA